MVFHEAGKKTEKAGKPQIRFVGFDDEWEQCKFSELVLIERGGSPRPIDDYITDEPNGLNWVKIGDAPTQGHYITKTAEKIKLEGLPRTRQVQPGDLILSNSMSFGKPYIMAINGCIHDGWLLIRDINNIFDLTFLCHLLGTTQMLEQYKQFAAGSTVNNLNKELVGNTIVSIPAKQEQRVLGKYFEQLDHFITLYQSKCDKLTDMKKSMCEKMFPKDGEAVPEIRFKEFFDLWEQYKLSGLCSLFTDGDWIEAKDQSIKGVRLIQTGNVGVTQYLDKKSSAKWVSEDTFLRLKCKEIFEGDILISRLPEPAGRACIMPNLGTKMITAVDCTIVRTLPEISSNYLVQYLSSEYYFDKVNTCLAGGTRQRISRSNLAKFKIPIPKEKNEQMQIGEYFKQLDHLITLHRRKLEKLKNLKKAFLEKMFI